MTTKQTELQNAIILACHPGLSLDEAKQKELGFGCMIKSNYSGIDNIQQVIFYNFDTIHTSLYLRGFHKDYIVDIIGLPPTLDRVIVALGTAIVNNGGRGRAVIFWDGYLYDFTSGQLSEDDRICDRKRLNNNGTSATLRDQSEATQDILYNIICKK